MDEHGTKRRDFLKLGLVTAAAAALGPGVMKPVGLWAATPAIKGPIKVGYQASSPGPARCGGLQDGALMAVEEINALGNCGQQDRMES
jgi:branched-chain amino acid transport system substrate-binding protein